MMKCNCEGMSSQHNINRSYKKNMEAVKQLPEKDTQQCAQKWCRKEVVDMKIEDEVSKIALKHYKEVMSVLNKKYSIIPYVFIKAGDSIKIMCDRKNHIFELEFFSNGHIVFVHEIAGSKEEIIDITHKQLNEKVNFIGKTCNE